MIVIIIIHTWFHSPFFWLTLLEQGGNENIQVQDLSLTNAMGRHNMSGFRISLLF